MQAVIKSILWFHDIKLYQLTHSTYFEMRVGHLKFGINRVLRTQDSVLIRADLTFFVLLHCNTVVFYLCHLLCHSWYVITHDAITIAINITNTFLKKRPLAHKKIKKIWWQISISEPYFTRASVLAKVLCIVYSDFLFWLNLFIVILQLGFDAQWFF